MTTFIHLLIASYFIHASGFANAEGCKVMTFKDALEGKALKNHVIKTKRATNDGHCESMCFLDDRCIAYSFGRDKDQQKNMCELSESDHVMHPDDLVDRPDTNYRRAENNCNCTKDNFQACRVNFVDNTHQCECKAGFIGQRCEIEYYIGARTTWYGANTKCKELGTNLPSIHSAEENAIARKLYVKVNDWLWIGLHDPDGEGGFVWSDGTPVDYTNWNPSQTHPTASCVYIDVKGLWSKFPCNWKAGNGCILKIH